MAIYLTRREGEEVGTLTVRLTNLTTGRQATIQNMTQRQANHLVTTLSEERDDSVRLVMEVYQGVQ